MVAEGTLARQAQAKKIEKLKTELMKRRFIQKNPVEYAERKFPYKYWAMQAKIIESALKNPFTTVKSCHGSGKGERNGTPVLTPIGWKAVETLKKGQTVISGTGKSTKILGVYPQGIKDVYRVSFSDGTFIDCDAPHLWTIKDRQGRDNNGKYPFKYNGVVHTSPWKVKNTKEIFDFYQTIDKNNRHLNYELPLQPIVKLRKHKIPLDPYTLGLLLGDGCMTTKTITFVSADREIVENNTFFHCLSTKYRYGTTGLVPPLTKLNLIGKRAATKSVPENYKFNAVNVRLAVLQGLMDTDGGVSGGGLAFSSISKQLAEDVQFLVRSLGGYANINSRTTAYISKGEKHQGQRSYRVYIRMDELCPFRLTRKIKQRQVLNNKPGRDKPTTGRLITSVELLPDKDETTCIRVADESGLFITKDFIITHNSFLAGSTVLLFMEGNVPSKCLTTAPSNHQVETVLWAEIRTQFSKANPAYPEHWRCLTKSLKVNDDHFALGFATDDEINLQGIHGEKFMVVVDEAAGVELPLFHALASLLTSEGSRMLLISNPDNLSGYFYESHTNDLFTKFTISAFDTPNFTAFDIDMDDIRTGEWQDKVGTNPMPYPALCTPAWAAKVLVDYGGEETPLYVAKVFGEFPSSAIDSLFPLTYITQAQKRTGSAKGTRQWGLDVARQGTDTSVLRYRRGDRLEITQRFHQFELTELVEWVAKTVKDVDPSAPIAVDAVGLGAGVADMLRNQKNFTVFDYQGNSASSDDDCRNQRSEFYWHLRKRFVAGKISGNLDERTKAELCAMTYKIEKSQVRVCKKADIKKKISRSPDNADALMLTYAPIENMSVSEDIIIPKVGGGAIESGDVPDEMSFVPVTGMGYPL